METINRLLNLLFDVLLLDFLGMPRFWELAVISVLFAVGALWVFKHLSNQQGIRAAKDKIVGHLLEILLYKDDVRVVFRAQGKVLAYNMRYLGHNLPPVIVLLVPFVFVVMNLDPRYRFDPVDPGEEAIVTAAFREGVSLDDLEVRLEAPDGVAVEAGPVRAPTIRTVDWRVRPEREGVYELAVVVGEERLPKRLVCGERVRMLAPKREGGSFLYELANPGEPLLADSSPVRTISVSYQRTQTIPVLGIDMHWLVVFLIVSLGFGFAIKGVLGVEI